jgi:glycosyltransferase involved in cell wall biosynthesis
VQVLLVHQNFPGQFKHLGPALVRRGDRVVALTMNDAAPLDGIDVHSARASIGTSSKLPWAQDIETKLLRGEAAFQRARELRSRGFVPDVIVGHMGWGDTMFLKDVWPGARFGVYCEYFYRHTDDDAAFDPEMATNADEEWRRIRLKLKSLPQRLHFPIANAGLSPTIFQADTYPAEFRARISVIHDGIDTETIAPRADAYVALDGGRRFTRDDEIITFVARNLEPYRGYHVFMRALPELLRRRPEAHVFIVGGNGVSYGAAPPTSTWREIFWNEVKDRCDVSRVHFVGQLPLALFHELLSLSRLHIYLTYPFVLSWSMLEAMALGAPVLGSRTAPVEEVIRDGHNGLLVDFFNREDLVNKAEHILSSPDLRESLASAARRTIVEGYDLKSVCLPQQTAWVDGLAAQAPLPPMFE